jgi:polyhydroxyalkanoate synthesis repressor PhaR
MPRIIKRYENRKLYDFEAKRYVCMRDVAEIIRSGIDVVVMDNATGDDLTAQTLAKVIADGAGRSPLVCTQYLHDVVRWGGDHLEHWIDRLRSSVERTGTMRDVREELAHLRERLASLDALVNQLEKEEIINERNDDGCGRTD